MRARSPLPYFALSVLGLAVVTVAGLSAIQWVRGGAGTVPASDTAARPAEDFGQIPEFTLIERSGSRVSSADLAGRVWVANFIYTRCTDTCPLQSARIAKLQDDFAGEPDVRFVSLSVDPEYDSPAVLTRYAARFGAAPSRWLFLTGEKSAIYALLRTGFHVAVDDSSGLVTLPATGPARPAVVPAVPRQRSGALGVVPAFAHTAPAPGGVMHSSWFVLVDRALRIRGYYPSEHPDGLAKLAQDIPRLLRDTP